MQRQIYASRKEKNSSYGKERQQNLRIENLAVLNQPFGKVVGMGTQECVIQVATRLAGRGAAKFHLICSAVQATHACSIPVRERNVYLYT